MPRNNTKFWNSEKDEKLKELYGKYTYNQIAGILKCTSSAVAGRVNRLKLSESAKEGRKKLKPTQTRQKRNTPSVPNDYSKSNLGPISTDKPKRRPNKTPPVPKPLKKKHRIRLPVELKDDEAFWKRISELKKPKNDVTDIPGPNQCHYIFGDVKYDPKAHWCRKPTIEGKMWCSEHNKLVHEISVSKVKLKRPIKRRWV